MKTLRNIIIIALLIFSMPCVASEIMPTIASGTIAAGVLKISNASGAYFVDPDSDATASAAFLAAVKHHDIIEIISKTNGTKLRFCAKEAGTGETYLDLIGGTVASLNNGDFSSDEPPGTNWERRDTGIIISSGVCTFSSVPHAGRISQSVGSVGALIKITWNINSCTNGAFRTVIGTINGPYYSSGNPTQYTTQNAKNLNAFGIQTYDTTSGEIDNFVGQQVLTPAATGVLSQKTPGGSDGFGVKDASFTYNDSAGYNWKVISSVSKSRTVLDQAETTGHLHIDLTATAMFFSDDNDYSDYAGGATANYLLAFYDSSGVLVGSGYGGAVGGGEALGVDLLSGWDLTSGWLPGTGATINDADTFTTIGGYQSTYKSTGVFDEVGGIHQIIFDLDPSVGDFIILDYPGTKIYSSAGDVNIAITCSGSTGIMLQPISASVTDVNTMSVKRYTDIPATGLTLYSDKALTSRGLLHTGSGNANKITKVKIYRAF